MMPLLLKLACSLALAATPPAVDPPPTALDKLADMPDLCQADPHVMAMPAANPNWCGPVAVSNALVWLDAHGYPEIVPGEPGPESQARLAAELASSEFMNAGNSGTPPKRIVRGLERFFHKRGLAAAIETMGWRSSAARIGRVPDSWWICASTLGDSNVVLNIGWYKHDPDANVYNRLYGHYVTVAGYERRDGHVTLHIHDPAARDGQQPSVVRCPLRPLDKTATLRQQNGDTQSAEGFFELSGIRVRSETDLGIIDGAIAFRPVRNRQAGDDD